MLIPGETDIKHLRQTSKSDVLDLLNTYIHPSSPTRSKLSTHMRSTHTGGSIKFDVTSAQPLIEAFTKHSIVIDQIALQKLMTSNPDLQAVKDFANAGISAVKDLTQDVRKELQGIVDALKGKEPAKKEGEQEGEVKLREGNVYIEDIHQFKAGLRPSRAALPLEPLGPVAKL
jgi:insulysin